MCKNDKGVLSNLSWKLAERISAQLVTLIVTIVLARLIEPEHYGVVSIVTIFIAIANVFVSDGFGSALVQKKNVDAVDFWSVFYFNLGFSILLYFILFFCAPFISYFFGSDYKDFTYIFRVLSLRIILSAVNTVQQAYISRKMMFEKFFWGTLIGTVISAVVGIGMAYGGCGVWAVVAQYLVNTSVDTLVLSIIIHKKPVFVFSYGRIKDLIKYGSKILGTGLLITGYDQIRGILIGKLYSSADLAYYTKGQQFPHLIVANINASISAVLFPRMAIEQEKPIKVKEIVRKSIRFTSYIMSPMMLGLAVIAPSFVIVILTEKWAKCIPLIQVLCLCYLFYPIHSANMQAIKAVGRSDITLKVEVIKKIIELLVLFLTIRINVEAMVIGMLISSFGFIFINAYPNKKLIGYTIIEQFKDIFPSVLMSLIMFFVVRSIEILPIGDTLTMVVQIVIGFCIYVLLSIITKNNEYQYLVDIIKAKSGIENDR